MLQREGAAKTTASKSRTWESETRTSLVPLRPAVQACAGILLDSPLFRFGSLCEECKGFGHERAVHALWSQSVETRVQKSLRCVSAV